MSKIVEHTGINVHLDQIPQNLIIEHIIYNYIYCNK